MENKTKIFNSNQMIAKLYKIYEEIKECDSNFCSLFLAIFLSRVTCVIALAIIAFIFGHFPNVYLKFTLGLAANVLLILFMFVIHMSSSVNYVSKKTYKLLASYQLNCILTSQCFRVPDIR